MSNGKTITVRRSYLVGRNLVDKVKLKYERKLEYKRKWMETFYDTECSSLSNAECMLMKDSTAANYWKFFCYAHNNIMEITTDEQDIHEPLSRLMNFRSPDYITNKLLQSFFSIENQAHYFRIERCQLRLTETDYGFAFCTFEYPDVPVEDLTNTIDFITDIANNMDEIQRVIDS